MNKNISKWAVFPGLLLSLIIAALFLSEWVKIGIIANPEVIDQYSFGSESMVGKAWYYNSAETYANSALIQGLVSSTITAIFVFSLVRNSKQMLTVGYSLLLIGMLANLIW